MLEHEGGGGEPLAKRAALDDEVDLDEEIQSLAWVDDVYEREVKGHMARLHLYNETKVCVGCVCVCVVVGA